MCMSQALKTAQAKQTSKPRSANELMLAAAAAELASLFSGKGSSDQSNAEVPTAADPDMLEDVTATVERLLDAFPELQQPDILDKAKFPQRLQVELISATVLLTSFPRV